MVIVLYYTSLTRDPMYRQVRGVCSAGFRTTVFPQASAGPSFHAVIISGKFHCRHKHPPHTQDIRLLTKGAHSYSITRHCSPCSPTHSVAYSLIDSHFHLPNIVMTGNVLSPYLFSSHITEKTRKLQHMCST